MDGVALLNGSTYNSIGGMLAGAGNLISGNQGNGIYVSGSPRNVIEGNYIGCDLAGTSAMPNGLCGVNLSGTSDTTIGGGRVRARNLIGGNAGIGISITAGSDNVIQGNFIGLDDTGAKSVGNGSGIFVLNSERNLIGGREPETRNLISGNQGAGIEVSDSRAAANQILGNYIGTDQSGAVAVPNDRGVLVSGVSARNLIQSNLVSGNLSEGIAVIGISNVIAGNFVGTEASGRKALPNGGTGVAVGVIGNTVGGVEARSRNVISGNGGHGIEVYAGLSGLSWGHVVQGNFVGIDVSGMLALPNEGFGIAVATHHTTIGGAEPGAGNVISGNRAGGVAIGHMYPISQHWTPTDNVLEGNLIGADRTGIFGVPNDGPGVMLAAANNFIGGKELGEGNVIGFNTGPGVLVTSNAAGNVIAGNSIHSNGRLGIDLGDDGVTRNDVDDEDMGPNGLQNYPVITNVVYLSNNTIIQGYLRSSTNGSFSIDVFANVASEQSGYGEGELYLGNVDVDTDDNGFAEFALSAGNVFSNQFFTATALNYATGDTSEFSAAMGGIRITAIERMASQYRVSFNTRTNHTYVLEYANDLNSSMAWVPVVVPPEPIAGTGGIVTVSDVMTGMERMRIYRVREEP